MAEPPLPEDSVHAAESNLPWLLGITCTFHAIALLFVALRVYSRVFQVRSFGIDGALIVASVACACGGGMVTLIMSGSYGLEWHANTKSRPNYAVHIKLTFVQSIVSTISSLASLKLSIGAALMRLSNVKWYRRVIWGFIGFVIVYSIISWVEWFLVCRPREGFWDKSVKADCLPTNVHKGFALFNTIANILTDIVFASLPIPIIWQLQMKKKLKVYLVGILSLGYFAVLLGIVKTVCQNVFRGDPDQSFYNWIQFWGFLQINVGIIAAYAPTLRRIFARLLGLKSTYADPKYTNGTLGYGNRYSSRRKSTTHEGGWIKSQSQTDELELITGNDRRNHEVNIVGGADSNSRRSESSDEIMAKDGNRSYHGRLHQQQLKHHHKQPGPLQKRSIVSTTVVTVSKGSER